jgi:hypothetical protein
MIRERALRVVLHIFYVLPNLKLNLPRCPPILTRL